MQAKDRAVCDYIGAIELSMYRDFVIHTLYLYLDKETRCIEDGRSRAWSILSLRILDRRVVLAQRRGHTRSRNSISLVRSTPAAQMELSNVRITSLERKRTCESIRKQCTLDLELVPRAR